MCGRFELFDGLTYTEHGHNFNIAVAKAIRKMEMPVTFITPSAYDITEE